MPSHSSTSSSVIRHPSPGLRVTFMGTPAFALPALEALHAAHEIIAVYTQPPRPANRGQKETPSPVHAFALEHNLPVYTPTSLKSAEAQAQFAAHKADVAVVAAYGLLLPKPILEAYPMCCINIHPSLLPRWRGAAPLQRTLMAGDTQTGVTIMQMDEGLDTGAMLACKKITIPKGCNFGQLHDLLARHSTPLLLHTLQALQQSKAIATPQSLEGVEYAQKITKADCRINWEHSAKAITHQVQGLSPSPGAYFTYQGEQVKVFAASFSSPLAGEQARQNHAVGGTPGTILSTSPLAILCGGGVLLPLELQRPGKKRLPAEEFLRGMALKPGDILE